MEAKRPSTTRMGISEARARLTSLVNDVYRGETRLVVEKSGIPVAVVVSPADLATLEKLDRDHERLLELMDEMQAAFADVPEEELIEQADVAVKQVREEMRAEARARAEVQAARAAEQSEALVGVRE